MVAHWNAFHYDDAARVVCHPYYLSGIRDDVDNWLVENWPRFTRDQPPWFTAEFRADEEFVTDAVYERITRLGHPDPRVASRAQRRVAARVYAIEGRADKTVGQAGVALALDVTVCYVDFGTDVAVAQQAKQVSEHVRHAIVKVANMR